MSGKMPSSLQIRLGEYDITRQNEHPDVNHEEIDASRITIHPAYSTEPEVNDIALIRLARTVVFKTNIRPMCLPIGALSSNKFVDQQSTVIGWGMTNPNIQKISPVLMEVTMPVWEVQKCRATIATKYPKHAAGITDKTVCGGGGGTDSCMGDSGGPMMVRQGEQWYQIGIVSWGIHCGTYQYPGIYTRVTSYLDWIKQNAR
jgi:secreted trypsin-like serine protease